MIDERWHEIEDRPLLSGAHEPDGKMCVMEAVAYVAREPWSDHPVCVSPVMAAFLRTWNDNLDDERRQMLKPYILRVIGTNTGAADEERRAWLATDWLVREFAPAWLDLAGLGEHASNLRALPELMSDDLANAAIETIKAADSAAYSAAYSAARSAARSAAYSAAYSAADSAAYSAARSAAYSALAPTVLALQESALRLLDRMIAVGKTAVVTP